MARRTRLALSVVATLLVAAAGAAETVRIVADRAEVRREANAGGSILGAVSRGTVLQVLGREGGWVQVAYPIGNGAFYGGYVPEVFCEDARGAAPSASQPPTPTPPVGVRPKDAWFTDPSAGLEPAPRTHHGSSLRCTSGSPTDVRAAEACWGNSAPGTPRRLCIHGEN